MKVAADMLDAAKQNLADFTSGPLAAFKELKEPAPQPPPVAATEEVIAAEPVAAATTSEGLAIA
jgi:hypothetical protein